MYVCVSIGQKRGSDLLKLELHTLVSCPTGVESQLGSSGRGEGALHHRAISLAPENSILNPKIYSKHSPSKCRLNAHFLVIMRLRISKGAIQESLPTLWLSSEGPD